MSDEYEEVAATKSPCAEPHTGCPKQESGKTGTCTGEKYTFPDGRIGHKPAGGHVCNLCGSW
jgi:hypothetical protein